MSENEENRFREVNERLLKHLGLDPFLMMKPGKAKNLRQDVERAVTENVGRFMLPGQTLETWWEGSEFKFSINTPDGRYN